MFVELIRNIDYSMISENMDIVANLLIFVITPFIGLFLCIIYCIDYYGYRKRFFSIVIYKKCYNLLKLEAKHRKVSKKVLIEDIINNHYRNYHPDIQDRLRMNDKQRKRWDYKP
jgi:hypothetical protein